MKISFDFKNQDAEHISLMWHKLTCVKNNIEKRLHKPFLLEVDPVREKFYLIPLEESFSFGFPGSYFVKNKEFKKA